MYRCDFSKKISVLHGCCRIARVSFESSCNIWVGCTDPDGCRSAVNVRRHLAAGSKTPASKVPKSLSKEDVKMLYFSTQTETAYFY